MDSQCIETATHNEESGVDVRKKIKGRQRHLLVDTLGLIVTAVVTSAATADRLRWVEWLSPYVADGVKRLRNIWGNGAYPAEGLEAGGRHLQQTHTIDVDATTTTEGRASRSSPGAGWWNEPSPGCSRTVAIVETMRDFLPTALP